VRTKSEPGKQLCQVAPGSCNTALNARFSYRLAAPSSRSPPVAPISRRSHSGSISKLFGQVGAPSSRNVRAKYAGSRKGSPIGPLSPTSGKIVLASRSVAERCVQAIAVEVF